jgi:hypothetical protein
MFKSMKFAINDHDVETITSNFGLKRYALDRLTSSESANDGWRRDLLGQAVDTPGFNDQPSDVNHGWNTRRTMTDESRIVHTRGVIPLEIFENKKIFPPSKFHL